jgi:hypothetical protein
MAGRGQDRGGCTGPSPLRLGEARRACGARPSRHLKRNGRWDILWLPAVPEEGLRRRTHAALVFQLLQFSQYLLGLI